MIKKIFFVVALCFLFLLQTVYSDNNPYGVHAMLQDGGDMDVQLGWIHRLVGNWGYVKEMIYPVTREVEHSRPDWIEFVKLAYKHKLIPVIRVGGEGYDGPEGGWAKPYVDGSNDFTTIARNIANVVSELPKHPEKPLYIEIWNEPNLNIEWSGHPDPVEFGYFYVQTVKAIRALGDPRIKVGMGALSPGGDVNNLKFIDILCKSVPEFKESFDIWYTHPYPQNTPPWDNLHNGTAKQSMMTIDSYLTELEVLKDNGFDIENLKVIATETGYSENNQVYPYYPKIDSYYMGIYTESAFRDYWSKWPEILAVCPFAFYYSVNENWKKYEWVKQGTDTDILGYPVEQNPHYYLVEKLPKPKACPEGRLVGIVESATGEPLEGIRVALDDNVYVALTDETGNYLLDKVCEGTYKLTVGKYGFIKQEFKEIKIRGNRETEIDVKLKQLKGAKGVISITADGAYYLYVNGEFIGSDREWTTGETYPIVLPKGKNVIGVKLTDPGYPNALFCDIEVDGKHYYTGDEHWILSDIITDEKNWSMSDYNDSDWQPLVVVGDGFHSFPWTYAYEEFAPLKAKWVWGPDKDQTTYYFRAVINIK